MERVDSEAQFGYTAVSSVFESAASGVIIESPVKFLWVGLIVESQLRVTTVE